MAPDGGLRTLSNRLLESTSKSDEQIASTREAVSKVMSEFQRDGVIETRNRRVVILDREALSDSQNLTDATRLYERGPLNTSSVTHPRHRV